MGWLASGGLHRSTGSVLTHSYLSSAGIYESLEQLTGLTSHCINRAQWLLIDLKPYFRRISANLRPVLRPVIMSTISSAELDEIYAFAVQLGKDAGDLLMSYARARWSGSGSAAQKLIEKDSSVDIVTQADEGAC